MLKIREYRGEQDIHSLLFMHCYLKHIVENTSFLVIFVWTKNQIISSQCSLVKCNRLREQYHKSFRTKFLKGDILYPDSSHITFEQKQVLISNFAPFLVGSSDWLRRKHFFFGSAQLATDLSDQQWSLSQKLKMFCNLSKRKKEPKFKMNTQFNSNVIWLELEYKISTLGVLGGVCNENKFFPVQYFSQGKTCFHYRDPS